ncbi:MAG: 5-carboxymethyl-2-hydroxymuconate semialdehyde dehydrogenase [Armatimonadota bacterium]|nr:5-carboxymethyl-2-hydroxymuconate semialdehyde dehydrogenase [Armatimonadota bacterium]MDR5697081.1 5-carboxymethyl-2-hydroxymuconate semialdehyde dehydrogenase [Armatimonadota bacterium]
MRRQPSASLEPARHFIAGEFVDGVAGRVFETLNPATNEPITEVTEGTAEDIDRAVRAARTAFDEGPWPRMRAAERAKYLRRIGDLINAHVEEIGWLETLDTGLPISQSGGAQIPRAAENFYFFAEMATRIQGESYPKDGEFLNYTVRHPVGVAGLITPWNTPFMLETWKVAPCLAAGNTCVLKPAEWSPLSATKLARIIQQADLPPGVFNVVHGFGETAGAALVAHPMVQLISFTGETRTGMEIMRNGAATLKRFSMELGGKNPTIVFADADLERALDAAIFMIFSLNGERCTAGSRLLLERPIYDIFLSQLRERVASLRVGDPFDPETEVGPLIHPDHWERVRGYIDVAREEGARILLGGDRPPGLERGNYFEPTLITDVRPGTRIEQEEIFGPVLAVLPFGTEEEAIRIANGVRYGLAAYLWTRDNRRAHTVAQAIEAGMVWVNSHNVRDLRTPFGGMKHSGIGREGGVFSFEFYTEYQTVHVALGRHGIPRMGLGRPAGPPRP